MNLNAIGGYWPLYEDGSPVRIGDTVQGTFDPMTVESVEVYATTTTVIGDCDHLHLSLGERVERVGDAPEGVPCLYGDPDGGVGTAHATRDNRNWHIVIDDVRCGVSNHARRAIAEALDLSTSRQTLPSGVEWPEVDGEPVMPGDVLWDLDGNRLTVGYVTVTADQSGTRCTTFVYGDSGEFIFHSTGALTRTEPELDRDGAPIEVGDTVYVVGNDRNPKKVTAITNYSHPIVHCEVVKGFPYEYEPQSLTHKRVDSWERLTEDALKDMVDYWSCRGINCSDCPAVVDGKTPYRRYDTGDCSRAKDLDIVARAKALAVVTDDE